MSLLPVPKPDIALITDSSAQLTPELIQQYQVEVIPVTISLDGQDYQEGVDLDADKFYRLHQPGSDLSTSQPPPGLFVEAVERAAVAGATEVLAILVSSDYSGTVQSAKVAATQTSIPLHIVDTGTASFGVACCVIAAHEALEAGASVHEAIGAANQMSGKVESVFVLQGLELAGRSGRFQQVGLGGQSDRTDQSDPSDSTDEEEGIMVLWTGGGELEVVDTVFTTEEAVQAMASRALRDQVEIRVASSLAGPEMAPMSEGLDALLAANPLVKGFVHYRVGPSVAAQTGPGTAGIFYYPA